MKEEYAKRETGIGGVSKDEATTADPTKGESLLFLVLEREEKAFQTANTNNIACSESCWGRSAQQNKVKVGAGEEDNGQCQG